LSSSTRVTTTLAFPNVIPYHRTVQRPSANRGPGTLEPDRKPNVRGGTGTLTVGVRCPPKTWCRGPEICAYHAAGALANFGIKPALESWSCWYPFDSASERAAGHYELRNKDTGGRRGRPSREMGEIVNLRRARKIAKRREDAARAAENRFAHGRTKNERALEEARAEKSRRELDAHRLETEDGR